MGGSGSLERRATVNFNPRAHTGSLQENQKLLGDLCEPGRLWGQLRAHGHISNDKESSSSEEPRLSQWRCNKSLKDKSTTAGNLHIGNCKRTDLYLCLPNGYMNARRNVFFSCHRLSVVICRSRSLLRILCTCSGAPFSSTVEEPAGDTLCYVFISRENWTRESLLCLFWSIVMWA